MRIAKPIRGFMLFGLAILFIPANTFAGTVPLGDSAMDGALRGGARGAVIGAVIGGLAGLFGLVGRKKKKDDDRK